jgi:hypothetical protein
MAPAAAAVPAVSAPPPAVEAPVASAPPPAVEAAPVASAPPLAVAAPGAAPVAFAPPVPISVQHAPQPVVASEQPPTVAAPAVVPVPAMDPAAIPPVALPADPAASGAAPVAPMLVIVPEPVTPLPLITPAAATRTSAPSSPAVRLSGVELIADLFECMHDLHFLSDALAGADFVIALMLDKLPSAAALVHFYDIDAREFVVVRAVGAGAAKVMQIRTNEKEPLIAEAMRKRRAVVIGDAAGDPRAQNGRWALVGDPPRTLVCAPVEQGGRFLGLLEIANPLDGQPFHEGDGHAITYIGEQFAEFLAARGVILDPERIGD